MTAELTVRQKILVAAVAMNGERESFSVEDLIVKTWTLFPESFSLRGYAGQHPDSNRVLAKLSGADGLCGLGWLDHVEQRMYTVTRKGRTVARQLAAMQASGAPASSRPAPVVARITRGAPEEKSVAPAEKVAAKPARTEKAEPAAATRATARGAKAVTREVPVAPVEEPAAPAAPAAAAVPLTPADVVALERVAKADALRKFLRGHALTFADACAFWGISSNSRPAIALQRIEDTSDLLKRAVEAFGASGAPDARMPSLSTCYGLFNLHRLMMEKFARELDAFRLPLASGG